MTAPLDPETKRLRGLTPPQIADEIGQTKAAIAALNDQIELVKNEAIRRNLNLFDSELFHVSLTPPGTARRLDSDMLKSVFGVQFVAHFSKETSTGWILRCSARPARRRQGADEVAGETEDAAAADAA